MSIRFGLPVSDGVEAAVCLNERGHNELFLCGFVLLGVNFVDSASIFLPAVNLTTTTLMGLEFQILMATFPD